MGTLGFTGFNALFYAAAHHTTAINIAIIQGTIPVLVLVGSLFFFATRITALQIVGVVLTLGGHRRRGLARTARPCWRDWPSTSATSG